MTHILFSLLAFISTILIVVSVHEFGHFIVARIFKIKVLRFSIGFGKVLWSCRDKKNTEYAISAIPLGGYVRLLDEREGTVEPAEQTQEFNHHPIYQRFLVLIAGVVFNLIFAFLAYWLVFSAGIVYVKPIIGSVITNSPAAQANIKPGEEIIAIDNQATPHWAAVAMTLVAHYGESGELTITTQKSPRSLTLATPFYKGGEQLQTQHVINLNLKNWRLNALRPDPLSSLGIVPDRKVQLHTLQYPIFTAAVVAYQQVITFLKFNASILHKMITGVISWKSLGGPFTIFQAAAMSANQGVIIYINFLALLSISIAIVNLFPIPGLDGAQLVYLLIEFIRRKPLSIDMQLLLFRLGVICLALLMVTVLMNDLLRLF
jgi:regulator of sigma E protease